MTFHLTHTQGEDQAGRTSSRGAQQEQRFGDERLVFAEDRVTSRSAGTQDPGLTSLVQQAQGPRDLGAHKNVFVSLKIGRKQMKFEGQRLCLSLYRCSCIIVVLLQGGKGPRKSKLTRGQYSTHICCINQQRRVTHRGPDRAFVGQGFGPCSKSTGSHCSI